MFIGPHLSPLYLLYYRKPMDPFISGVPLGSRNYLSVIIYEKQMCFNQHLLTRGISAESL